MAKPIFSTPDLTTFARLDTLDLTCIGQHITANNAILKCRPNTIDEWCRRCGGHGSVRDTVIRRLAHEPFGHRPTTLHIRLRRYKCIECGHVWRQDTTAAAPTRAKISRSGLDWALRALVVDHDTVSVIADKLAVSWHTANSAVLAEEQRLLINDPNRFAGVSVIGVDDSPARYALKREVPPPYGATLAGETNTSPSSSTSPRSAKEQAQHAYSTWPLDGRNKSSSNG